MIPYQSRMREMIKIEVKSVAVQSRQIISKQGQPIVFHEQEAWAHTTDANGNPHPYPQRIILNIDQDKGQQPYQPGIYTLAPESLFVNRFNSLQLGRAKLRPVAGNVKAAA